jgi:hypothetical protein
VGVLTGWLCLGGGDTAAWQQARGWGEELVGGGGGGGVGVGNEGGVGGGVVQLLTSWGVLEAPPGSSSGSSDAAAGGSSHKDTAAGGRDQAGLCQGPLAGLLGLQHGHPGSSSSSSSGLCCLLLSGHGSEGQAELAAATLKLMTSRAGEGPCLRALGWGSLEVVMLSVA